MADDREEAIRLRAYAIWKEEGCPHGHYLRHWLKAEEEIAGTAGKDSPPAASGEKQVLAIPTAA